MNRTRKLSVALAILLFLQIGLSDWSTSKTVEAAPSGPVAMSFYPADNLSNVPLGANLRIVFDENVNRGSNTTNFKIYRSSNNQAIETIPANSSKVSFPNQREAVIDPAVNFEADTEYFVLIDGGFFSNASNNATYAGVQTATTWNFRTTTETTADTTNPGLITPIPITYEQNAISSLIKVRFNERVYASRGDITLASSNDTRYIPITSSSVTGSGTTEITIIPEGVLEPDTRYTLTISNNNFEDASGNKFSGTSWVFNTSPANVYSNSFYPADNTTLVPLIENTGSPADYLDLIIQFNVPVQAIANKYVEIRRVSDNYLVHRVLAMNTIISGSEVSIDTEGRLAANTVYYVLVDPGAYAITSDINDLFYGINGATVWNFSTGYGNDTSAPTISTLSPTRGGTATSTTANLVLTFNEPVYPDSGNIEIRQYVGDTLFRSIPVTSSRVKGGGTTQLVIDATSASTDAGSAKAFLNNTRYYVKIGNRAIRDGAGNYLSAITDLSYWAFTITQDGVRPNLTTLSPVNGATTIDVDSTFIATFDKPVFIDTTKIVQFISVADGDIVPAKFEVDSSNNRRILITPGTGWSLSSNTNYYINIEEGAITDLVGNSFVGIANQYQWTFLTKGGDNTAPTVSSSSVTGSIIRLVYDEPLDTTLQPSAASYYVTVAGLPRNVMNVKVEGNMVLLTLSSSVSSNQKIELSYTKPSSGLVRDLSGNQAASLSKLEVTGGASSTTPVVTSASASGNTVVLNFSEALMSPNPYAYTQFTVRVGGSTYGTTSLYQSGSVVQLTLSSTIPSGQSVSVSYSSGIYPLYGVSGNPVSSFSNYSVTGGGSGGTNDSGAPYLQSITANGAVITLKYSETLNHLSSPSTSQYVVLVNGQIRAVNNALIAGDSVLLSLSSSVTEGQTVTVSYTSNNNTVADMLWNPAASFSNVTAGGSIGVGGTASMSSAILKGSKLTLTFNEVLSSTALDTSMFMLRVKGSLRVVSGVQVTGNTVILTLANPANVGEAAEITYFSSPTGLRTVTNTLINSFSGVNVANQTTLLDTLTGDYEAADGGGVAIKSSGAIATTDISPAGVAANRYTVNDSKFNTAVATSRDAGLTNPRIVFKVPDYEKAAIVAISTTVLELVSRQGNVTFAVQHGDVTFELPVSTLNFAEISRMAGGGGVSNYIWIAIDQGSNTKTTSLTSAISSAKASIIAGPVNYEVMVLNGSKKEALTNYNGYISRSIKTTSNVDESQSSVVWLDSVTGTLSYVPTTFETTNGVTRATFQRKGNSAYALVKNTSSFTDMGTHWAKDTVQMMARKFIVEGHTVTKYEPDKSITRGEFATYIAKGLGLTGDRTAAAKFKDFNSNTVMGAYIGAAAAAGIVNGVDSSNFKPNSYITRQDMATMMMRAWASADKTISLPNSPDSYLSKFTDRSKISSYAKTNMAQAIYLGIINGKTATTLSPTTNATRAEGAVMIMRLLEKAEFLTQ